MATPPEGSASSSPGSPAKPAARPGRWSDLGLRVASAAVLAPLALACVWFGGLAWTALIMAAAGGLALEWVALCGHPPRTWPAQFVLVVVLMATAFGGANLGAAWPLASLAVLALATLCTLARDRWLALGIAYVGVPVLALCALRGASGGRLDVLLLLGVVWASDIGAYLSGRLLRGPKLAPALSPAKTWSGAIGGLIGAMLVGQLVAGHVGVGTALFAGLLAIACQAGDLLESGIKRHVGVKDSGILIPGHGGLLDRLDGLLAAAPVAALVMLASREGVLW